ncbi:hypothetical protein [Clostridium chromiireducens]|uniref:Uncharacterized protein n=1 Tax=Clostridium chromiireducens TaxID=225345 RepID=A0A1V4IP17_9CLOT|nr:hypothetical protein [Clostridium chromiireducens]OPJ61584.1 hypothetical protein CLCHR_23780 [Clostridium chromiireducens]RII34033.1 hypothetical protein D2A34_12685 [Clostridium chromiireducens]
MNILNLKKFMIIFIPITIFILYYTNYDFHLIIKSTFFATNNYTVHYKKDKELSIPLPSNSAFLFKTPTEIYYNKYDINKCKSFFDSTLNKMKQNQQIGNYNFNDSEQKYIIEIDDQLTVEIYLIGNEDSRRYGISNSINK